MAFDQAIADKICARLSTEPISLLKILRDDESMPSHETVYRWLKENAAFRDEYARARSDQADADDEAISDVRERMLAGELTPEQARVAIDSLKWQAGKRKPKVYGDRIDVTGESSLQVIVRHVLHTREPTAIEAEPVDVKLIAKK